MYSLGINDVRINRKEDIYPKLRNDELVSPYNQTL
jgi:hypothetical protein